jgi:hypothetical protein
MTFPVLMLLFVNVVNFGGLFYSAITVVNAARNGSQYLVLGGATIGAPGHANASLIHDLVVADSATLLNPANVSVRACKENKVNPSASLCSTFGSAVFTTNPTLDSRGEANFYTMAWVDVQYDYEPYISLFTVPVLGVPLTTPPTTLRSRSVMRMLQ